MTRRYRAGATRAARVFIRLCGNVAVAAALCLAPILVLVAELTDRPAAPPPRAALPLKVEKPRI